jgi:hypothetical protein
MNRGILSRHPASPRRKPGRWGHTGANSDRCPARPAAGQSRRRPKPTRTGRAGHGLQTDGPRACCARARLRAYWGHRPVVSRGKKILSSGSVQKRAPVGCKVVGRGEGVGMVGTQHSAAPGEGGGERVSQQRFGQVRGQSGQRLGTGVLIGDVALLTRVDRSPVAEQPERLDHRCRSTCVGIIESSAVCLGAWFDVAPDLNKEPGQGLYDPTTDPEVIKRLFQDHPTANIGLGTRVSFHVVDLGGEAAAGMLEQARSGGDGCKDLL